MSTDRLVIRRAKPEDAEVCGRICYEAFHKIATSHGFPPDLPTPEHGIGLLSMMFNHPGFWCVVAELNGQVVGSNCLDERGPVFGVGPITVDPNVQNSGIGKQLMQAVMERSRERAAPSVRLLQAAFHNRSLSLYTKLGYDPREPISVMNGPAIGQTFEGYTVRPATQADLDAANRVCIAVHGHHRSGELADGIKDGSARVVERQGRITGYASALAFFSHAVAESNLDMMALIASAMVCCKRERIQRSGRLKAPSPFESELLERCEASAPQSCPSVFIST